MDVYAITRVENDTYYVHLLLFVCYVYGNFCEFKYYLLAYLVLFTRG